jgi:transcriptional regulator with XRE-family HTH domain
MLIWLRAPSEIRQQKILIMSPAQCRAARALIDWTQPQLAAAAGLGLSTVVDFEKERRAVSSAAISSINRALEGAGVLFVPENGEGVGVRLRKEPAG